MPTSRVFRRAACLIAAGVALVSVPAALARDAGGHFEVYCDSVGFFLEQVPGAPAPEKLLVFLYTHFEGAMHTSEYWLDVTVYRDGCTADQKCDVLAHGKIHLDDEITPLDKPGKRVSGTYDIDLNGQHLQGRFAAEMRPYTDLVRFCE